MLLSELDFSGQPLEPKLHEGPISFDGKVQYEGRTPEEEMSKLEAEEEEAYHDILQKKGLRHEDVGDSYPLPMSLKERGQVLQDIRSGNLSLRVFNSATQKTVVNSVATKGILGDSDFALGSMPGSDQDLYNDVVHICLKDNVEFCIVFEGEWQRIWFRVWSRNIDSARASGKTILVLTKPDGTVGFNQSIEVAHLRRRAVAFVTMRADDFALQRRPMIRNKSGDDVMELLGSHPLLVRPLLSQADCHGNTALHYWKSPDLARRLLEARADVNQRNFTGETPLMVAAQKQCVEKVEVLLQHGADVNALDHQSRTALHLAASQASQVEGAKLLLSARADLSLRDTTYEATPLEWASYNATPAKDDMIAALQGKE